jgi:hypothetical protein
LVGFVGGWLGWIEKKKRKKKEEREVDPGREVLSLEERPRKRKVSPVKKFRWRVRPMTRKEETPGETRETADQRKEGGHVGAPV